MNPAIHFAEAIISLAWLFFVVVVLFRRQGRDRFRCDILAIRAKIFDHMLETGEGFDAGAYIRTRQMLNSLLRLSNQLNIVTFFIIIRAHVKHVRAGHVIDSPLHGGGSVELKMFLEKQIEATNRRLLQFVFLEGIVGVFVNTAFTVLGVMTRLKRCRSWAFKQGSGYLTEAFRLGSMQGAFTSLAPG